MVNKMIQEKILIKKYKCESQEEKVILVNMVMFMTPLIVVKV